MASHLGYAFSFLVSCCSRPTHCFLKREKEQALENNNKDSLQLFLQVRISGNIGYDSFWVLMQEQVFLLFLFLFLYARKRGFRIYSYGAWISQNLEFYFVFFRGHRFGRVQVFYEDSFRTTGILTNQKKKNPSKYGERSLFTGAGAHKQRGPELSPASGTDPAGRCMLEECPPQSPGDEAQPTQGSFSNVLN